MGARESVSRGTLASLAAQVGGALFTAALTLFLVRALGAHSYGVFAVASSVVLLVGIPADVGISSATARFVVACGVDRRAAARVIGDGLRLKLIVTVPLCAALIALAGPIAGAYGMPGLAWPLRAIALVVPAQGVVLFFGTAFAALTRLRWYMRVALSESVVETGASVLLVLLAGGATAAAWGRSIGYLAGAALALTLALRALGRGVLPRLRGSRERRRAIARYAGAVAVVDGAFTVFNQADVLLLGLMASAAASGAFQAVMRLCALLHYPGLAVADAIAPRAVRAGREGSPDFDRALRLLLALGALEAAVMFAWADPISRVVFGPGYGATAHLLMALAPFVMLSAIGPLASMAINYIGAARRRIPVAIAAVAVNVVLDIVLIPRIGALGAAVGTDVAYALYVPAHLWWCCRLLGARWRPLLLGAASSLLAALACAGALTALGAAGLPTAAELALGAPLALLVFAAVMLATGELSADDLRSGSRAARGVLAQQPSPAPAGPPAEEAGGRLTTGAIGEVSRA